MGSSSCPQCGHPLADGARFCGQCGAATPPGQSVSSPVPAAPAAAPAHAAPPGGGGNPMARTMVGYAWTDEQKAGFKSSKNAPLVSTARTAPIAPQPTLPNPSALASPPMPSMSAAMGSAKRTMMGISVSEVMPSPSPAPAAPAPAPAPQGAFDFRKGTMLGVAMPGIAPASASVVAAPRGMHGTMIGVAVPGIAPSPGAPGPGPSVPGALPQGRQPRKAIEIAPKPAPLVDDEPEVGPAPRRLKRGLPLGWVAAVVSVLVVMAGGVAFLLLRSHPLMAEPRLDGQGHEELHLTCESCEDGTVAELNGARATFKHKEADLAVARPLKVGNNPLTITVDRPNLGRDESVRVIVPVAFRVRADLSELAAVRPAITVRIEAIPGTAVTVDGKPVTLDSNGDGTYSVDISSETEGLADELRMIDRLIPYTITQGAGQGQAGKLTVRVGIAPLHLDAPGLHAVVDGATFRLAGRTVREGGATANGAPLRVETDGTFAQPFDIRATGDLPVEVRATGPQLAPRTAHLVVRRVDRLADEAKAREAFPEASYDSIVSDLKAAVGTQTVVEGDVVEARTTSAQTVGIVDDTRGCSNAPCLVRITYGGDTRFKHGDTLRVYGRVTRSVAYGSSTVPEVEADFVQLGRAAKH